MSTLTACIAVLASASLDRWLGLDALSLADPEASLGWARPLPAWAWGLVVLSAIGMAVWSYARLQGSPVARTLLAALRAMTLVTLAVLLAGPELTRTRERVEPDWVVVLVDRSASMTLRDVATPQGASSRDEQLREALGRHASLFGAGGLAEGREVRYLGFADRARAIDAPWSSSDPDAPAVVTLPDADGRPTQLRTAIDQALDLAQGRPLSGVIVMSDGRSPEPLGGELVRRLRDRLVGVYAVPLGAAVPPRDLSVTSVDAPLEVFVDDLLPVSARVDLMGVEDEAGLAAALEGVTVRLIDPSDLDADGEPAVLDEAVLGADGRSPDAAVRLQARARSTGPLPWRVVVVDAPRHGEELVTTNNAAEIDTVVIDRPLRVLYVEAYPRWEFRYLKNLLLREASVEVSTFLLSADRAFAQEGDRPIARLPETREEFEDYDVIVLGDVPADVWGLERLERLRSHVAERGGGMLWIGGAASVPMAYAGSPLEDLLPMRDASAVSRSPVNEAWVRPTPLATSLSVMELRGTGGEALALAELPPLTWFQDVGELKPAAEVLARATGAEPNDTADAAPSWPAVMRMRFGAGQVLYVASDETWRWRLGRGELVFEQFWIQLVRLLARGSVEAFAEPTTLSLSSRRVDLGQSVVIELTSRDPAVLASDLSTYDAVVRDADDASRELTRLTLRRQGSGAEARDAGRVEYRALWRPRRPGSWRVTVSGPGAESDRLSEVLEVRPADAESRRTEADHAKLASLAEATGGAVVPPERLAELVELIPSRPRRTPFEVRESIWDSWAAFMLVGGLLSLEWLGRKLVRLV